MGSCLSLTLRSLCKLIGRGQMTPRTSKGRPTPRAASPSFFFFLHCSPPLQKYAGVLRQLFCDFDEKRQARNLIKRRVWTCIKRDQKASTKFDLSKCKCEISHDLHRSNLDESAGWPASSRSCCRGIRRCRPLGPCGRVGSPSSGKPAALRWGFSGPVLGCIEADFWR